VFRAHQREQEDLSYVMLLRKSHDQAVQPCAVQCVCVGVDVGVCVYVCGCVCVCVCVCVAEGGIR
jgi:hypothetical protein